MDIVNLVKQKTLADGICNVVVAGGTCSGKTTLANELQNRLATEFSTSIIRQDCYFKDIQDVPSIPKGYLMDSPNAFHAREFKQDAERLLHEGTALVPHYDVAQNKRMSKNTLIKRAQVNIFEGLHTISLLDGLPNTLKIFLATPLAICLDRRIGRDTKLYGVGKERITENFNDCIVPMYHSYIAPQMERAEIKIEGVNLCGAA